MLEGKTVVAGGLLLALLLTPHLPAVSAASEVVQGEVRTHGAADIQGTTTYEGVGDAVHLSKRWGQAGLSAEHVTIRTAYSRGYEPESYPLVVRETSGEDLHPFTAPTVTLTPYHGETILLANLSDHDAVADVEASGAVRASAAQNKTLVGIGPREYSATVGDFQKVGYWYTFEGPGARLTGMDRAVIRGDFTLFVHNVTMTVTTQEGTWTNWTGYKEDPSLGPAPASAPEGTVTRFELRVSTLEVTNGTLVVDAEDSVDLYGSQLDPHVIGTVTAREAAGQMLTTDSLLQYDGDTFTCDGQGTLLLSPAPPGSAQPDVGTQEPEPRLALTPSSGFDVLVTQGVSERKLATGPAGPTGASPLWFIGAALLLIPLGLVVGRRRRHTRDRDGSHDPRPEAAGSSSHGDEASLDEFVACMLNAEQAHRSNEFERAEQAYRSIAARYTDMPEPWIRLSRVHLARGRPEDALAALRRFEELVDPQDPDALSSRVLVHLAMDEEEPAEEVLVQLSGRDPRRARRLLDEPSVRDLAWSSVDRIDPDLIDLWLDKELDQGHNDSARRLLACLIRRAPHLAHPRLTDPDQSALAHASLHAVSPRMLTSIIRDAWLDGQPALARSAFVHLVNQAPTKALRLAQDPIFEPLRDDVRVARALDELEEAQDARSGDHGID